MGGPLQLRQLIHEAGQAPFVPHNLVVDPPLWGGFWHADVISAGYTLPALELALLRATRLDKCWSPGTDPARFLVDLQAAATQPRAGVWTMTLAGMPLAVFAAPGEALGRPGGGTPAGTLRQVSTVVWYGLASGCLYAGYRGVFTAGHFTGMGCQQEPGFQLADTPPAPPGWLAEAIGQRGAEGRSDASRLDHAILRWRSTKR